MPFLISGLDGEKFFTGRALPVRVCLFSLRDAGQSISPLRTNAPRFVAGFCRPPDFPADMKWSKGMDRNQKAEVVSALNAHLAEVGVVVVTRNLGLTVAQSTQLRQKMREAGGTYKVTKNRLAKIALEGTDYSGISDLLTGPVGLASSADPVAAAKVAVEFAKTNDKLEIVGGAMGEVLLNAEGVKALASMPSLDELRAKLVGLLVAPATKLATVTQAPAAQLARVFNAYAEKNAA
ncbi:50S ribosomal protein L10 [Sphingobium fuliginis]|jgi:large subunit ribosomal protein L10|uniref:Large ribosomal subunit protein uL10 n=3 Tax=Sphingobium fuliginis (strain ATCC 27551) TaxID=336203 RepID=A0ABQ1ET99_SPHSA|nr:50S ribosomal protein L10 [Sphingobium fuliginis]